MAAALDLTGFGFTPTEGLVYEVLVRGGPGTGYAIARTAGLARANAYSALEGLVQKGAARVELGRPKRYRPEPPATLIARIVDGQAQALDQLAAALAEFSAPATPSLVELTSLRGALQVMSHEIARAQSRVVVVGSADGYPTLTPALRKAAASGVVLALAATSAVDLAFAAVHPLDGSPAWPGEPLIAVIDDRGALLAARTDDTVAGYWGTDPVFVATARLVAGSFRGVA